MFRMVVSQDCGCLPDAMRAAIRRAVILMLAAALLTGCGSDDDGSPDPTATVAATPTAPAPTPPLEITLDEIVWTSAVADGSGAPVDTLTSLPNNAGQVVAAVPVDTLPAGVTIQARWSIDGEPLPTLDPAPLVVDEGREDAWIAWTLTWTADQPWPIGTLGIEVQVNGEVRLVDEIIIVRARDE